MVDACNLDNFDLYHDAAVKLMRENVVDINLDLQFFDLDHVTDFANSIKAYLQIMLVRIERLNLDL